jgi:hypothetical protein
MVMSELGAFTNDGVSYFALSYSVRFGSKADIETDELNVGYTSQKRRLVDGVSASYCQLP